MAAHSRRCQIPKVACLTALAILGAATAAHGQNDSLPEPARRGIAVLVGGSTCHSEGECFLQGGIRLAGLKPDHIGPDVAVLVGKVSDPVSTFFLLDLSAAHASQLGGGLFFLPRLGVSVGSFYAVVAHAGAGLLGVLWDRVVVRLDATYRNLYVGEFGLAANRGGLWTLTLGIGAI